MGIVWETLVEGTEGAPHLGPKQPRVNSDHSPEEKIDDCDAFDSNVDEAPTAQTMFMANLSFADLVYDEVGPSYDSDILSEKSKQEARMKGYDHIRQKMVLELAKAINREPFVQLEKRRVEFSLYSVLG
nr:hypothetical protein [Tanacetum cinerariifolium]